MDKECIDRFLQTIKTNPQVLIITGGRGAGKTTTLRDFVAYLKQKGIQERFSGFLAVSETAQKRKYFAQSIDNSYKILLMQSDHEHVSEHRVCTYNFDPKAFSQVEEKLKQAIAQGVECLIIDEVARLEVAGKGWANLIEFAQEKQVSLVLTVRSKYLKPVSEKFDLDHAYIIQL